MSEPFAFRTTDRALAFVARVLRQARAALLALADRYRRNRTGYFAEAVRELAGREPVLARAVRVGQLHAYLQAGRRVAKAIPISPPPGGTPPPPGGHFSDEPGVRFPALEAAAQSLRERLGISLGSFAAVDSDAKQVGVTLARAATTDAAARIQAALAENLERGGTPGQFRAAARAALGGGMLADTQLENLYRTQMARAYSAGQIAVLEMPLVRSAFPYLLYSATHDARVRPEHLQMERLGLNQTAVYRADDPIWDRFYPPWAWRCRCLVIPLSVADAAGYGVREAKEWLRTGRAPLVPEHVAPPPFDIPMGWVPTGRRLRSIV